MDEIPRTIEFNGGHIDIYKNSVIFHDDVREESWEYDWKELYKLTDTDYQIWKPNL
jgi:hypothetical protein